MLLHIGEVLGMSLQSVRMLPASEITLWASYFKIKAETQKEKPKSDIDGFKELINKKAKHG